MTDTTAVDKQLKLISTVGLSLIGLVFLLSLFGVLGSGMASIAALFLFLGTLFGGGFTIAFWFYGLVEYNRAKRILTDTGRYRNDTVKRAKTNVELFSRYVKIYPIWVDIATFNIRKYEFIYE